MDDESMPSGHAEKAGRKRAAPRAETEWLPGHGERIAPSQP
jgi:hypothetical protein